MRRELEGKVKYVIAAICIFFTGFQLYVAGFGSLADIQQPSFHIFLGFTIVFALWGATKGEAKKKWLPWYDFVLILVVAAACFNAIINHLAFIITPYLYTNLDLALAVCLVFLVLEATRRTIGWVLPGLALFMIIYSWATGSRLESIFMYLYHQDLGIWGTLTYLSSTIIAIFLIFGAFLLYTGGGQTFTDIALSVAGKYKGGPAKVAVVASALFGMLSGSPVANTATTGNFTIPLMKKVGYKPEVAGAIEATASTGGELMPPVMGAAAFVMAELLGIAYLKICIHAIIPAILYFTGVFFYVHFEAVKTKLSPFASETRVRDVLNWARLGPLVLPLIFFIGFLVLGFTPIFAAFLANMLCLFCFIFRDLNLSAIEQRLKWLGRLFTIAGSTIAYVVPLLICAQIVVGMLGESGLGVMMASAIIAIGEHARTLALFMAAILAIMLGMGIPPVGAYVLAAAVTSPALLRLEVLPIASHMFCFNFATFAAITPPVCAAVYVGAAIAGANWLKTGFNAVRIGIIAFIVPFSYVLFDPYLLGIGSIGLILANFALALVGALFIASGVCGAFFKGRVNPLVSLCFGAGGLLILIPFPWHLRFVGSGLIALGLLANRLIPIKEE